MKTAVKQRRRYRVKDQSLLCEICGRRFKRPQALFAHKRMLHLVRDKTLPDPDPGIGKDQVLPQQTIENLKSEVAQLKLEREKRQLEAELPAASARPLDIMEQAGLGKLEGESKELAQKRALGIRDQGQAESWLGKLLSSPEGIKTALDGLKGVLGVSHNNEGGGLGILKELGIDLKSLWERGQATKADSSFKVGGISLDGCALTPEVLTSLIAFKQAEDNLTYQKTKDDSLREGMQTIIEIVKSSGILNRLGGSFAGGAFSKDRAAGDISREITPRTGEPGAESIFDCPACGFENKLPADLGPGVEIHCQAQDCKQSFMIEDHQARQSKPGPTRAKKQVKVEPPIVEETPCPGCGQLVNLDNRSIGEIVKCPACLNELTVTSEILAAPAQDLTENEKHRKQLLRNQG